MMYNFLQKKTVRWFLLCCLFFSCISQWAAAQSAKRGTLNKKAFCFYYNWYGNPQHDGKYVHWAHGIMKQNAADTTSGFIPGGDNIATNFYPQLGTYSSNDPVTVRRHMQMIEKAGIGTIVLTWWGQNHFTASSVRLIMDEAAKKGIRVAFHIEPFGGRTAKATREAVEYLIDTYGSHPAFYRSQEQGNKPLFFIYDSYLIKPEEWTSLLQPNGSISIRNTAYDAIMIGLWLSESAKDFLLTSGFDGFYTYFASTGFTQGSNPDNWNKMARWAEENNKLFIPCVGPGYIDTRVRPWNNRTTRDRKKGNYYDQMFAKAIESKAPYIAITSFNEWHEGTQIEPAVPFQSPSFNYLDYAPLKPDHYLKQTKHWLKKFHSSGKPQSAVKKETLKVLSYNIHHCNLPGKPGLIDVDAIVRTIKAQQPDIVALQEVDVFTGRSGKLDQAKEIAGKLGLNVSFGKAIDYDGGEYGLAILSKYALQEVEVFRLPSDPSTKGEPRIFVTAKIKLPSGQMVRLGNTHLDAQRDSVNREMQVAEILRIARSETLPFIIAGDFNAAPDSHVIQLLDSQFTRTCRPCASTIPSVNPTKAIDFIAYAGREQFRVMSHEVIQEPYASDHLPVLSTVQIISSSSLK